MCCNDTSMMQKMATQHLIHDISLLWSLFILDFKISSVINLQGLLNTWFYQVSYQWPSIVLCNHFSFVPKGILIQFWLYADSSILTFTLSIFYCSIRNNLIGHKFHNLETSSPIHTWINTKWTYIILYTYFILTHCPLRLFLEIMLSCLK